MPEAFAVFAVVIIAVVAWVAAWMHARNPANNSARDEVQRLRAHTAWLEERLDRAGREGWGSDMIATLADERNSSAQQLARAVSRELGR